MLRKLSRLLHWGQALCDLSDTVLDVVDLDKRVNDLERSHFKRQRNKRKSEQSQDALLNSLLSNVAPIVAMYLTTKDDKPCPIPTRKEPHPVQQEHSTDPQHETLCRILQTIEPMAQLQTDLAAKLADIEADILLLKARLPAPTH